MSRLPLGALALIIASRVIAIADGRDPGFDQAMLMSNFPLDSLAQYFRPLPYFEQATALGSVMELDLVSRIFGAEGLARFTGVRILAAMAACLGYYLLYRVMRPSFRSAEIALILILMASPQETLLFTTNPKNYVNEFLAACLLIAAAARCLRKPDVTGVLAFLAASLLACVFSFLAPVLLVAAGGGLAVATLLRNGPGASRETARLAGLALPALGLSALFYLFFTRIVTMPDQSAYADRYATTFVDLWNLRSAGNAEAAENILRVLFLMVAPSYLDAILFRAGLISGLPALYAIFAFIALVGLPAYFRRSKLLAGGLLVGGAAILVLNAAHLLPIASTRHFMFLAPFAVPSFALGVVAILQAVFRRIRLSLLTPAIAAITLAIGAAAVLRAADLENTEVSAHLDRVAKYDAPLWIYYGAQPSVRALRPELIARGAPRTLGLLRHETTMSSWTTQARGRENHLTSEAYYERAATELAGTGPIWLLFAHYWPEAMTEDGLDRFYRMAEADGRVCRRVGAKGGVLALCALPEEFPAGFVWDD
ncbi:MAG: hypothetical protein R3E44_02150 [Paracoccaceae bacterium]